MVADVQQATPAAKNSEFVNRVTSLPTVGAAITVALSSYSKIKEYSPAVVTRALEAGENAGSLAYSTSAPLLEKLSGPIQYVDNLACQGLDKVEEMSPMVKETPQEIYEQVKQYGLDKVSTATEMGAARLEKLGVPVPSAEKVIEYRDQISNYATSALSAADAVLEEHLTSCGLNGPNDQHEVDEVDFSLRARLEEVSRKAGVCVRHHATQKLETAQKAAQDGLHTVVESLQVVSALRAGVSSGKPVEEIVRSLNMEWLSAVLKESKDKPVSEQAIFVAHAVASHAHQSLMAAAGQVNERLTAVYTRVSSVASSLTSSITSSATFEQLSSSLLTILQQQASHLQALINQLSTHATQLQQHLPEVIAKQLPKPQLEERPKAE